MTRGHMSVTRGLLAGAAAGAAGTTALNLVTYLDMVMRGRGSSSTPQDTVEQLSERTHVPVPGDDETRDNRLSGLGAVMGIAAGCSVGAVVGVLHATRLLRGSFATTAAAGIGAMVAGNAPMTVLGVTDPRTWSAGDWLSDVVPHIAYAAVTASVLELCSEAPGRRRQL